MNAPAPRLRVFAGPNGSGKSTIKEVIPPEWLGVYVNPDEIEKTVRRTGRLDLREFETGADAETLKHFLREHPLLRRAGPDTDADRLEVREDTIGFGGVAVNSYHASVLADFIRHRLMEAGRSFTFETVMSSRDKVEFLRKAKAAGYRTYLYFIATEDPQINVSRVKFRARNGGHAVPEDKIRERYGKSLALLNDALKHTDRAYLFDNSGEAKVWLAEITDGDRMEFKTDAVPAWLKTALPDFFA